MDKNNTNDNQNKNKVYCTEKRFYELYKIMKFVELDNFTYPKNDTIIPVIDWNGQEDKKRIFAETEYTSTPSTFTFENVICAFKKEENNGYARRKKTYKSPIEILSQKALLTIFQSLQKELCLLDYYKHYKPTISNLNFTCDGISVHPYFQSR